MNVAIFEKSIPDDNLNHHPWNHWTNYKDRSELSQLALNKYIRERGGFFKDELPMSIFVLSRKTMELPCVVFTTEFRVGFGSESQIKHEA